MREHLQRLYNEQLGLAAGTAQTAQRALEFEMRANLDFIVQDYSVFKNEELDRVVGAKQLLQDLDKLENYKIKSS